MDAPKTKICRHVRQLLATRRSPRGAELNAFTQQPEPAQALPTLHLSTYETTNCRHIVFVDNAHEVITAC